MAGGGVGGAWSRRGTARARTLLNMLRDTQRALGDVADILTAEPEISSTVQQLSHAASRAPALVVVGVSAAATARLLHCLLGRRLLPEPLPRDRRWLRVRYGAATQAHLVLGSSEFELVEELESNKRPWDTIPLEDLLRQDCSDLSTVLEVELDIQFLKDGLTILVPPDIDPPPDQNLSFQQLKDTYAEFYAKRDLIFKNFNPIFLYALDRIGKNVFSSNFSDMRMVTSRSEDDFWSTFNLYYMTRSAKEESGRKCSDVKVENCNVKRSGEPCVFSNENCLELHQIKELHPNAQFFFFLFSDSCDILEGERKESRRDSGVQGRFLTEATESAEDFVTEELPESDQSMLQDGVLGSGEKTEILRRRQYEEQSAFMNDLLDQWELMSSPPSKHSVKSQWLILDEYEMLHTVDQKALAMYLCNVPTEKPSKTSSKGQGDKVVLCRAVLLNKVVKFASDYWQTYLLEYCTKLSEVHVSLLQQFVLASFDLARELQVVPRKIHYVATTEKQLYETITEKFTEGDKKQELLQIMQEVLQEIIEEVDNMDWSVDDLPYHQDRRFLMSNSVFYDSTRTCASADLRARDLNETSPGLDNRRPLPNQKRQINNKDIQNFSTNELEEYGRVATELTSSRLNTDNQESTRLGLDNRSPKKLGLENRNLNGSENMSPNGLASENTSPNRLGSENRRPNEEGSDVEEAVSYESYNFDDYEIIQSPGESLGVSECFRNRIDRLRLEELSSSGFIRVENESSILSVNSSLLRFGNQLIDPNLRGRCTNSSQISLKTASLDVQKTVLAKLSRKISQRLVNFVDCLKDTYFGTLQRCLESLESSCRSELGGRPASSAMRALLAAAGSLDLQPDAAFSLFRTLLDSIRRLFHRLQWSAGGAGDAACCALSAAWRRQVAQRTARSLSAARLARHTCAQILQRLCAAHSRYQAALGALQGALASRLHHTEDVKLAIRKKYAPGFARLCLESTSMCDLLMYGTPELGREIGRGQYGVVYSGRGSWAGHSPVAIKSVLPADERHYQELAMEFFYTRSIPPHPRIVRVYGSIVSRGGTRGVLLVSARCSRDLHAAVRAGLSLPARLRVAIDIVEGIRYLHSLGLVHRDIKMKNVLLDSNDRAALTDLGFCAAEALISGSVVGTPVHMAPELLAGEYDASVDVYAFGILFWYVCAGNVKLPSAFETFQNKEQLWSKVRRGLRPERLPHFTDECWAVMESCWAPEPAQRALLGDVQPRLERILERCLLEEETQPPVPENDEENLDKDFDGNLCFDVSDDDSLYMTGLKNGL